MKDNPLDTPQISNTKSLLYQNKSNPVCPAGTFGNPDYPDCQKCDNGKYNAQPGENCKDCPKYTYSSEDRTNCLVYD